MVSTLGAGNPAPATCFYMESFLISPEETEPVAGSSQQLSSQSDIPGEKSITCIGCGIRLDNKPVKKRMSLSGDDKEELRLFIKKNYYTLQSQKGPVKEKGSILVKESDFICTDRCYELYHKNKRPETTGAKRKDITLTPGKKSPEKSLAKRSLFIGEIQGFSKSISSHHECIFRCKPPKSLTTIPVKARDQILVDRKIYIPEGARCCFNHLIEDSFNREDVTNLVPVSNLSSLDNSETSRILNTLVDKIKQMELKPVRNFDNHFGDISESECIAITGVTPSQFNEILSSLPKTSQTKCTSLGLYLAKLRSGDTDRHLAHQFNIPEGSVFKYLNEARCSMLRNFMPQNLSESLTREKLPSNHTPVSSKLFNLDINKSAFIMDGTYIYIQKSSNYKFQKQSYSSQKKRNLIKPFMIVLPDGYIVNALGPYEASKNDASIVKEIIQSGELDILQTGDILLVDRGFRDAKDFLVKRGFDVRMPQFIKPGEKQLTWQQANQSRIVTKCRFVVEMVNGAIKQRYRYFDHIWSTKAVPHLIEDFKIACAIYNKYGTRILSDSGEGEEIAQNILSRENRPNKLLELITGENLHKKRSRFTRMEVDSLSEFPKLSPGDIKSITLGTYQLKQAVSYAAEHISETGEYQIYISREEIIPNINKYNIIANQPYLVKGRIQSRFQSNKYHLSFILVDSTLVGANAIIEYYCTCKTGARTVGCCAHLTSIMWYLGYGRHQPEINRPAPWLSQIFSGEVPVVESDSGDISE